MQVRKPIFAVSLLMAVGLAILYFAALQETKSLPNNTFSPESQKLTLDPNLEPAERTVDLQSDNRVAVESAGSPFMLRGKIIVRDDTGNVYPNESGWISWGIPNVFRYHTTRVENGEWSGKVERNATIQINDVVVGDRFVRLDKKQFIVPESGTILLEGRWLKPISVSALDSNGGELNNLTAIVAPVGFGNLPEQLSENFPRLKGDSPLPIEFSTEEFSVSTWQVKVWVKAEGFTWSDTEVDLYSEKNYVVTLEPASELQVTVLNNNELQGAIKNVAVAGDGTVLSPPYLLLLPDYSRMSEKEFAEAFNVKSGEREVLYQRYQRENPIEWFHRVTQQPLDSSGSNLMTAVPPGSYRIALVADIYEPQATMMAITNVSMPPAQRTEVLLNVENLPVAPEVVSVSGTITIDSSWGRREVSALLLPAKNLTFTSNQKEVTLTQLSDPWSYEWNAGNLAVGKYTLVVKPFDYNRAIEALPLGSQTFDIAVPPPARLHIKTINQQGVPQRVKLGWFRRHNAYTNPIAPQPVWDPRTQSYQLELIPGEIEMTTMDNSHAIGQSPQGPFRWRTPITAHPGDNNITLTLVDFSRIQINLGAQFNDAEMKLIEDNISVYCVRADNRVEECNGWPSINGPSLLYTFPSPGRYRFTLAPELNAVPDQFEVEATIGDTFEQSVYVAP